MKTGSPFRRARFSLKQEMASDIQCGALAREESACGWLEQCLALLRRREEENH